MNPQPQARTRILVIEDTAEIRLLVTVLLEREGYTVISASDGEEGLASAQNTRPDLILLDVMMPGLDGYEVCRRLKQDEDLRDIPVIFMSAQDDVAAQTQGFEVGGADYVTKPLSVPVLLARARTHVALHAQRRSLEGMFRDALEYAPDAIILSDPEDRIVQVNAQTLVLFRYRREELTGQPLDRLMPHTLFEAPAGDELRLGLSATCLRSDGSHFIGDINLAPLQTNRGPLTMAVVRDVTESRRIQEEMAESRQRLRELAARGDAMREYERKNIAREVHDELGQVLTALRMDLSYIDLKFGADSPTLRDRVQGMRVLVDRAIQGVRNVAAHLRPSALDMGLVPALEWLCDEFHRHAGIRCTLDVQAQTHGLSERQAVGLFRIAQESLTNVGRYASACSVQMILTHNDGQLLLQVRDDGQGFDATAAQRRSYGLTGMQERALALGGEVQIDSAPGRGTRVTARVPWQEANTDQEAP